MIFVKFYVNLLFIYYHILGHLTNDQVEGVIDAFDEVAIEPTYDYCLTDDSEVIVYGENNKPYDNYRIQVSRRFGEEVLNEEIKLSPILILS